MTTYQHITDKTSFTLKDGDVLSSETIVMTGSAIGRILFTSWSPAVEVIGKNAVIHGCTFIGGDASVSLRRSDLQ